MKRRIQHCISYAQEKRFEKLIDRMDKAEREAKIRADCSGDPKVWTSALNTQSYLLSLIPRVY